MKNGTINLNTLLTSDESSVNQWGSTGKMKCWSTKADKPEPLSVTSGCGFKLMVHGTIGLGYKSPLIVRVRTVIEIKKQFFFNSYRPNIRVS